MIANGLRYGRAVGLSLMALVLFAGCTGHILPEKTAAKPKRNNRIIVVTANETDTFERLAATHLKDRRQGWRIAAYNGIETISKGQRLVIPKVPVTPGGLKRDGYQTVPVLAYLDMTAKTARSKTVSARVFQRHLKYLHDNGYTTISLKQLDAFLNLQADIPPNAVMITLDTTRQWAYTIAYPALKTFGMQAAVFFRPDQVGKKGNLTWRQLAQMLDRGIAPGIYGTPLKAPPKEALAAYLKTYDRTLAGYRKLISKRLNHSGRYFAYAAGKSDDLTIALLKKHGYRNAFTRQRGNNAFFADPFLIRRAVIHGHYDLQQLRANLVTFRAMELK